MIIIVDFYLYSINDQGMDNDQIIQIIVDIWKLTPVQVYRKHGLGFQTQNKINNLVNFRIGDRIQGGKKRNKNKSK